MHLGIANPQMNPLTSCPYSYGPVQVILVPQLDLNRIHSTFYPPSLPTFSILEGTAGRTNLTPRSFMTSPSFSATCWSNPRSKIDRTATWKRSFRGNTVLVDSSLHSQEEILEQAHGSWKSTSTVLAARNVAFALSLHLSLDTQLACLYWHSGS